MSMSQIFYLQLNFNKITNFKKYKLNFRKIWLFYDGGPYLIETNPLICRAWFLYDKDLRHESVKAIIFFLVFYTVTLEVYALNSVM